MHHSSKYNKPNTCFEYVARAQQVLEPYITEVNSEFVLPFLKGIELMVLTGRIDTATDPALATIIEIASRGTGIPKEAVSAYVEMAIAMNKPVQIHGGKK